MKERRTIFIVAVYILSILGIFCIFCIAEDIVASLRPYEGIPASTAELAEPVENIDLIDKLEAENNSVYFYLSDEEREVVENIVMGESGGEPYEGQLLVAQCIVNAAIKEGLQPSDIRTEYQYSGWNEQPSESVKLAVSAVFDNGEKVVEETVLYFYAPDKVESDWHESLTFVIEVGGHRFFSIEE